MPRKPMPWFRFYVEAVYDRKLRRQDPAVRWLWVAVLAIARQSPTPGVLVLPSADDDGEPLEPADIADIAALDPPTTEKGLAEFERLGMLERDGSAWRVAKWGDRQFESDNVTLRTRKHRSKEQRRNVPRNDVGTGPENREQSTDKPLGRADARHDHDKPKAKPRKATQLPADFSANDTHRRIAREEGVSVSRELVKFREHAKAHGRTLKDWDAGFCMWLRKANEMRSDRNGQRGVTATPAGDRRPLLDADGNPIPGAYESDAI